MMRKNWEIVTGCERISEGCDSCPSYWYHYDNKLDYTTTMHLDLLNVPVDDQISKIYSVAHGSDLFHESVNLDSLKVIFNVMNRSRHHLFEIVTKRIERASYLYQDLEWTDNILFGVAIESGKYRWRIDKLRGCPAKFKFLSACPILGPFTQVDLSGINKVGVVEESWGLKRPMKNEWVEDLKQQCINQGVEFSMDDCYLWSKN